MGVVRLQRRQKVAVPSEEHPVPVGHRQAGTAAGGRQGVGGEEDRLQVLLPAVLPRRQPLQLLQGGGEMARIRRVAGSRKGPPLRLQGKGHMVQQAQAALRQPGAPLKAHLPVGAPQGQMIHVYSLLPVLSGAAGSSALTIEQ